MYSRQCKYMQIPYSAVALFHFFIAPRRPSPSKSLLSAGLNLDPGTNAADAPPITAVPPRQSTPQPSNEAVLSEAPTL